MKSLLEKLAFPDSRRTSRSTKTTDRRLAKRLAEEWQDAADRAREGRLVEAPPTALGPLHLLHPSPLSQPR